MDTNIGAIILAAGFSERMKSPKLFLKYDENRTFLEKILSEYSAFGCKEIVVVINKQVGSSGRLNSIVESIDSVRVVINCNPERGRFSSLRIGIEALNFSDYCFLQNSDNPFVTVNLLKELAGNKISSGYVSPAIDGRGGHPILIGNDVIVRIRTETEDDVNLNDLLKDFNRISIETDNEKILLNINTPEEYRRCFGFESG